MNDLEQITKKAEQVRFDLLEKMAMAAAWTARIADQKGDKKLAKEKRAEMNAIFDRMERELD